MQIGVLDPRSMHTRPSARPPINIMENFPLIVLGEGGVPELFLGLESFYFYELGAHAKFRNPKTIFENPPLVPQNIL